MVLGTLLATTAKPSNVIFPTYPVETALYLLERLFNAEVASN